MFSNYKNSVKSGSLLILLALGFAAVFAPHSTGESLNIPHAEKPAGPAPRNAFGRLPLSFEPNQGQTDARVKFLARGHGYALFLIDNGAVFSFSETKTALHMRLQDAATSPRITGVDQLPGKVNYLLGNKSTKAWIWSTTEIKDSSNMTSWSNPTQASNRYDWLLMAQASRGSTGMAS